MEIEILPKSRVVDVSFQVVLPCAASREEIDEWIAIELGCGSISNQNPLSKHGLEVHGLPTLSDSGLHRHESCEPTERGHRLRYTLLQHPYDGPSAISQALASTSEAKPSGPNQLP